MGEVHIHAPAATAYYPMLRRKHCRRWQHATQRKVNSVEQAKRVAIRALLIGPEVRAARSSVSFASPETTLENNNG